LNALLVLSGNGKAASLVESVSNAFTDSFGDQRGESVANLAVGRRFASGKRPVVWETL
jgi:hypothetical protein